MIKEIRTYKGGKPYVVDPRQHNDYHHSAIVEVQLEDGRTVQLVVEPDGEIHLRGWGNVPAFVGNMNKVSFDCQLQQEPQEYDEHCNKLS